MAFEDEEQVPERRPGEGLAAYQIRVGKWQKARVGLLGVVSNRQPPSYNVGIPQPTGPMFSARGTSPQPDGEGIDDGGGAPPLPETPTSPADAMVPAPGLPVSSQASTTGGGFYPGGADPRRLRMSFGPSTPARPRPHGFDVTLFDPAWGMPPRLPGVSWSQERFVYLKDLNDTSPGPYVQAFKDSSAPGVWKWRWVDVPTPYPQVGRPYRVITEYDPWRDVREADEANGRNRRPMFAPASGSAALRDSSMSLDEDMAGPTASSRVQAPNAWNPGAIEDALAGMPGREREIAESLGVGFAPTPGPKSTTGVASPITLAAASGAPAAFPLLALRTEQRCANALIPPRFVGLTAEWEADGEPFTTTAEHVLSPGEPLPVGLRVRARFVIVQKCTCVKPCSYGFVFEPYLEYSWSVDRSRSSSSEEQAGGSELDQLEGFVTAGGVGEQPIVDEKAAAPGVLFQPRPVGAKSAEWRKIDLVCAVRTTTRGIPRLEVPTFTREFRLGLEYRRTEATRVAEALDGPWYIPDKTYPDVYEYRLSSVGRLNENEIHSLMDKTCDKPVKLTGECECSGAHGWAPESGPPRRVAEFDQEELSRARAEGGGGVTDPYVRSAPRLPIELGRTLLLPAKVADVKELLCWCMPASGLCELPSQTLRRWADLTDGADHQWRLDPEILRGPMSTSIHTSKSPMQRSGAGGVKTRPRDGAEFFKWERGARVRGIRTSPQTILLGRSDGDVRLDVRGCAGPVAEARHRLGFVPTPSWGGFIGIIHGEATGGDRHEINGKLQKIADEVRAGLQEGTGDHPSVVEGVYEAGRPQAWNVLKAVKYFTGIASRMVTIVKGADAISKLDKAWKNLKRGEVVSGALSSAVGLFDKKAGAGVGRVGRSTGAEGTKAFALGAEAVGFFGKIGEPALTPGDTEEEARKAFDRPKQDAEPTDRSAYDPVTAWLVAFDVLRYLVSRAQAGKPCGPVILIGYGYGATAAVEAGHALDALGLGVDDLIAINRKGIDPSKLVDMAKDVAETAEDVKDIVKAAGGLSALKKQARALSKLAGGVRAAGGLAKLGGLARLGKGTAVQAATVVAEQAVGFLLESMTKYPQSGDNVAVVHSFQDEIEYMRASRTLFCGGGLKALFNPIDFPYWGYLRRVEGGRGRSPDDVTRDFVPCDGSLIKKIRDWGERSLLDMSSRLSSLWDRGTTVAVPINACRPILYDTSFLQSAPEFFAMSLDRFSTGSGDLKELISGFSSALYADVMAARSTRAGRE